MDNAVISNHAANGAGVTFGLHLCRGNNQSKFYSRGDYGPITRVFQKTRFQRFLSEYDDGRSGGFEPLRKVPENRKTRKPNCVWWLRLFERCGADD